MIKITPADKWFSLCVRERANWTCERCGANHPPPTVALHCAHYMSRGKWSVRFDPENAAALCYGCHRYTEQNRESEHVPLMRRVFGDFALDRVYADAYRVDKRVKLLVPEIAAHYRQEHRRMQELRAAGEAGRIEFVNWKDA